MNPGSTFSLETLGCKLNFSEGSTISRQLQEAGFALVDASTGPDIFILNTCSVTEQANKKCRLAVRRARQLNPHVYTIVTGCYAQLKPEEILNMEGVNLVIGANEKFNIPNKLLNGFAPDDNIHDHGPIRDVRKFVPSYSVGDRTRSFMKVQDGCDYFCTFCTIPLARGKSRSPGVADCVVQAREIASLGVREIVLTGVNIGDFGVDSLEKFIDLIKALDQVEGIERYRISSIEPNLLTDEIIEFVSQSQRFVPHFHLPLQSASDELLKKMRRKYLSELYADRVRHIKSLMPQACIGVDVIVGFPGETDEEFQTTYNFLNDLDISYLHVFTYSERPNTGALKLEGKVDVAVRRERNAQLQKLSMKKRRQFYQNFADQEVTVLFEKEEDGFIEGFSSNYIRVRVPASQARENEIMKVKLEHLCDEYYSGMVINKLELV